MDNKFKIASFLFVLVWTLSSCGQYYEALKSTDPNVRYDYAKKMYAEKKYSRVVDLMSDVVYSFNGTSEGADVLYLLADSYYNLKLNDDASSLFRSYYTSYPKEKNAEDCQFKAGECIYRDAPDPKLDQSQTYSAIKDLQLYLDKYPHGKYNEKAEKMLFELQDRLAEKEYLSAKLYYDLGLYMGNNYKACVITAQNALKDYPYSKWKEELSFLILKAEYEQAINSVSDKYQQRLRDVQDQYYSYINDFPNGKYAKQAGRIFKEIDSRIEK